MAARTLTQIYDEMIAEKNTFANLQVLQPNADSFQTFLQSLTSRSKVAVWRLIFYIVALAIWTHEKLLDVQSAEVEQRALDTVPMTVRWYRDKALEFQPGDQLTWDGKKYVYSPVDITNRLVVYAAAIESNLQVILKVAKVTSGVPDALSATELVQFEQYMELQQPAGVNLSIISQASDEVDMTIQIFYDPLLINSSGQLISDPTQYPAEDAIEAYLADLGTTNFNGKLRVIDLVDKIQVATGVSNVIVTAVDVTSPAAFDVMAATGREYQSVAGHMIAGTLTMTYTSI